jgi:hypothetical protein
MSNTYFAGLRPELNIKKHPIIVATHIRCSFGQLVMTSVSLEW